MQDKKANIIVVGTTTKFFNFMFKHPLRAALILLVASEILASITGADKVQLLRVLWLLPAFIFFPILLIMYLLGTKWCYKIDK